MLGNNDTSHNFNLLLESFSSSSSNNSLFNDSPFLFGDEKNDSRLGIGDGNLLGSSFVVDNQPSPFVDMVYSTPPSSPEKSGFSSPKLESSPQFKTSPSTTSPGNELFTNCQFLPISTPPFPMISTSPDQTSPFLSTSLFNNGSIVIPRTTSIIAVDPLIYMQLLQQSYRNNNIGNLFSDVYPQLYSQILYQQLLGQQVQLPDPMTTNNNSENTSNNTETPNPKKRKSNSNKRPQRRVRPKVVPEKGAIQCIGMNRKKNQRCRNAALMEYIGPRPKYCAEHIHLDPDCLYMKCGSSYQKVPGDKKGCREVVLKEFGLCHKHFKDSTDKMVGREGYILSLEKLERVNALLNKLESEAMKAKKTNADLYQRKKQTNT